MKTGLLLAALLAPLAAAAQTPESMYVRGLAATCANCHGTDGRTVAGSALPPLAGLPAEYTLQQMRAFRDGSRPATVMHQIAKGFSEPQVQALAGYFAAQPK